ASAALSATSPLSLRDALPILADHLRYGTDTVANIHDLLGSIGHLLAGEVGEGRSGTDAIGAMTGRTGLRFFTTGSSVSVCCQVRSEEHTSELQSRFDLVCRLL